MLWGPITDKIDPLLNYRRAFYLFIYLFIYVLLSDRFSDLHCVALNGRIFSE